MNRADFAWALGAILPHTGKRAPAFVGLSATCAQVYVYSSDTYSMGIARIARTCDVPDSVLPASEARDLLKFIRPTRVAEQSETLQFAGKPGELHIATESDSAVYSTVDNGVNLSMLLSRISSLYDSPAEWDELIIGPDLVGRFAKAQRTEADRMRIYPRHSLDLYGSAIVTVGTDFIGAIAGMTYDQLGPETVSAFLNRKEVAA